MSPDLHVALVSDTHGAHDALCVPACDVLVHAGDLCHRGTKEELEDAFSWLASQRAAHRVVVPGNHEHWAQAHPEAAATLAEQYGVKLLIDEGVVIAGRRFWGSPWTPSWRRGAFMRAREDLGQTWQRIPASLDLLITHGPPAGVGDRTALGQRVGCAALRAAVLARPPVVHVFGHIHEARGDYAIAGCPTRFMNVASRRLLVPGVHAVRTVALT